MNINSKTLISIFGMLCFSAVTMAQDDDMYFGKKEMKTTIDPPKAQVTYYCGSSRDVDEYNRHGRYDDRVMLDSMQNGEVDDFCCTRKMQRFDDCRTTIYVNTGFYDPYYYDPFWYDPFWHDPFYYDSWYWHRPWGWGYSYYGSGWPYYRPWGWGYTWGWSRPVYTSYHSGLFHRSNYTPRRSGREVYNRTTHNGGMRNTNTNSYYNSGINHSNFRSSGSLSNGTRSSGFSGGGFSGGSHGGFSGGSHSAGGHSGMGRR